MGGFNIGIGVGIRYDTPIEKRLRGELIEDILDALLMEDNTLLFLEDGKYFKLEDGTLSRVYEFGDGSNIQFGDGQFVEY